MIIGVNMKRIFMVIVLLGVCLLMLDCALSLDTMDPEIRMRKLEETMRMRQSELEESMSDEY
ncbi:unnamed protein product [Phyllotreta striolata]|uniref:Secreted protein n=1 Tax=Phyllotreta striolata TaxID=444603 RepID=A0A9P0GNV5_PHYSR|nr:unnamed protein product [Phyllotreta striolata]